MAKEKCPPCECPKGVPLWLGTYGDMVTLILTFFILLLSMATFTTEKIDEAIGSLEGTFAVLENGIKTQINPPAPILATPIKPQEEMEDAVNIFASLITEYNEINKLANGPAVEFEEAEEGMIIRIPEVLLFESGSAVLTNSSGLAFLKRLTLEFDKLPETALIKAIGHTDNVPMRENPIFVDNLELSIARGVNVAQLIISEGISKERVLGGGEGEFSPIASNKIPELRAKNRRVDLYIYSIGEDLPSLAQNLAKSN